MLLREWRKAQGLTLSDAAVLFACSTAGVNSIEHGHKFPQPDRVAHIEAATGGEVTIQDHWQAWGYAHPAELSGAFACGVKAAEIYHNPKGRRHGRKLKSRR